MKKSNAFVVTFLLAGMLSVAHARTRALNPQPLPPGMRALNPQPLPPGMKAQSQVQVNPQPLPPGGTSINRKLLPGSAVGLNPQPYPLLPRFMR